MADLKLVGAVAIKVRPTADGFREEAERQVKKEARDLKAEVELNAKLESKEAKKDGEKLQKELSDKTVTWNVKLDHDSIRNAQKKLDSMLEPTAEIKFKVGDEKSIKEAAAKLAELAKKAEVKITYAQDEKGYQSVLDKIAAIRREKLEQTISFKTDDAELDRLEKKFRSKLAKAAADKLEIKGQSTIKFEYDENRESLLDTIAAIDKELKKFKDQQIYVEANKESLLKARAEIKAVVDELPMTFEYEQNKAGLEKVLKEIDAELEAFRPKAKIESLVDEKSLLEARAKVQAELDAIQETIEISYNLNRTSLQKAIDEINAALDDVNKVDIEVGLNEFELAWVKADLEAALAKQPVTLTYNTNKAGLQKAIAEIDALLAKNHEVKIVTTLDNLSLVMAKAKLEEEMSHQKVSFEYEENLESLKAVRAKIRALMSLDTKLHIDAELNDASLAEALAKVDAMIEAAKPEIKPKVKPQTNKLDYLKVFTELKALTKSQTVDVFVKLNNASVLLAAAKLTGLRAAGRWTEELAKSLGTLDRNLPIVAGATLVLNQLSSGILTLTADAFSLGNGLGEVARMAALLSPALILGFAAVKTVFTGVFKDFGAAINGDKTAIKKLTESGKEAAANIRVIFQDMREAISNNFWDAAGDSMLRFTKTALPAVKTGMETLATSMAGVFNSVVDAFSVFAEQNGIDVFFGNLIRGFDNVKTGMGPFMSAFLNLAALGSTVFPRMGAAFDTMSQKFDAWVKGLANDGTFNRWIDQGVQGIKDLWSAGVNLVKIWGDIGQAAQAAGALTLHSFAGLTAKLEEVTSGSRFQTNMKNLFEGARQGSDNFHAALKDLGPEMDNFTITVKNALALSGKAFGAFVADVGDLLGSKGISRGLDAFLNGLISMFTTLRPAMAPISQIFETFGKVMGAVATEAGPLFLTLFKQFATVLNTAWTSLEPFLPALSQIGTSIIQILGPALSSVARDLIPAFASGITEIGDGLVPVIELVAKLGAAFAHWVSDLPLPTVVGLTTTLLSLGGAVNFVGTFAKTAALGLEAMGISAFGAAVRVQLMVPVVGLLLAGITGLVGAGIATVAMQMDNSTPYMNDYAAALREDAKATAEFGKAVNTAQIKAAIKDLQDAGAFAAGKKLNLNPEEITNAIINGGKDMELVRDRINGARKAYDDAFKASQQANKGASDYSGTVASKLTPALGENKAAADKLSEGMDKNANSAKAAKEAVSNENAALKAYGIEVDGTTHKVDLLAQASKDLGEKQGVAAAASRVLTDQFASSASKVDAMRKTFDLLLGKDAKQATAETLGAYAKGFQDLNDSVAPVKQTMQNLGDAVYGENGFLNIAGGNKAVMQVNQALVDEVNNIWAGAKAIYDNAIRAGDSTKIAFDKAQKFINEHHGDFNQLAKNSGVNAALVQGQWDAIFGHEWVLKITMAGLSETAAMAQQMITNLKGKFDGAKFAAYFDAHPEKALKAAHDVTGAAMDFVTADWTANFSALPQDAQLTIRNLVGMAKDDWQNATFESILSAKAVVDHPALAQAIIDLRNGLPVDVEALVKAVADGTTVEAARNAIDEAAKPRTAPVVVDAKTEDANKKLDETAGKRVALGAPVPAPVVDFDVEGGTFKLDNTQNKVNTLISPNNKPAPLIDVDNTQANTKLDASQTKVDVFGLSRPNPFVDANTGTADSKLNNNLGWLGEIARARPSSVVGAIDQASGILQGIINLLAGIKSKSITISTEYLTSGNPVHGAGNVIQPAANGAIFRNLGNRMVKQFANGGIENHVAQIQRAGGPVRVWAEPETKAEAYIPYAAAKRPRSLRILRQVARDFGYDLTKATYYANGGINAGPSTTTHTSANVHIGTMVTHDMDEAVRKLDQARRDALAVAGIH